MVPSGFQQEFLYLGEEKPCEQVAASLCLGVWRVGLPGSLLCLNLLPGELKWMG